MAIWLKVVVLLGCCTVIGVAEFESLIAFFLQSLHYRLTRVSYELPLNNSSYMKDIGLKLSYGVAPSCPVTNSQNTF